MTAGISAGILLGRIVGGAVADWLGWRPMLLVFASACVLFAIAALFTLPRRPPSPSVSYWAAIRSLPALLKTHRTLRIAAISGSLWFFSFSLVWVSLSVALAVPPVSMSPTGIGLYSLAGLAGIAATRVAGSLADRYGSGRIIVAGLALALACSVGLGFSLDLPPVMLGALALFDAGLFAAQVANQSRVLGIAPARPAMFNSVYMVIYFIGGSLGTSVGGTVVVWWGWPTAALIAAASIAAAAALVLVAANQPILGLIRRPRRKSVGPEGE
ncbi:MFS transporter [Lacisediminihabitans sp.]|uniref:MFS transporter n=1 Tax=Lacisediminihabitans sp. TaxID=2787631 RepID=UPI00374DB329